MVRHASLRKIVRTDALGAVSRSHLTFALGCDLRILLRLFLRKKAAAQHAERLVFILVLAALVLTFHHHSRGDVRHADGGRRLVDVLAARARGAERVDAQIGRRNVHFDLLGLGHDRHRHRGRVDAPLRFRLGDALHAVHAALEFEAAVCARSLHGEAHFFHTAEFRLVRVQHFHRKAALLRVHRIHAQQARGKQCRLVAARTAADLHDHAAVVVFILGQKKRFQLFFQCFKELFLLRIFLLRHVAQLRVEPAFIQKFPRLLHRIPRGFAPVDASGDGLEFPVLLHQAAVLRVVRYHRRVLKAEPDLVKAAANRLQSFRHVVSPVAVNLFRIQHS